MAFLDKMEKTLNQIQAEEIRAICTRMGITWEELAERVPMKRETMRKLVNAYQPTSDRTMQQIRNVERMSGFLKDTGSAPPSPFKFMKLETLQRNLIEVSTELPRASIHERKHILGNLRSMLDELEERELRQPDQAMTEAQKIAQAAGDRYDREQSGSHSE